MAETEQAEQLLRSWVKLSGILKNNRISKGLAYNEAAVMLLVYHRYLEDGIGRISIKEIIRETQMLKSLVNRTVNSLEQMGLLERCPGDGDKRTVFVRCVSSNLPVFLQAHTVSLQVAQRIIEIIGQADAEAFIRSVGKLERAGYIPERTAGTAQINEEEEP